MPRDILRRVAATPFRIRDTDSVSKAEFIYSLSSDREWCTPSEAENLLTAAAEEGLVLEDDGELRPEFDPEEVREVESVEADEVLSRPSNDSVLELVVDELVLEKGYSRKEAVAAVNREHHSLGNVDVDTAAIVVAKQEGLDVDRFVERVLTKLGE